MKAIHKACLFSPLLVLFLTTSLYSQFYYLDTDNLRLIYYSKAHEFVVNHLARCFENSLAFHKDLFSYMPSEKVTVLLQDFGDFGNAGADGVPRNNIAVGIAPYSHVYETAPANERMNSSMHHELVHVLAIDKASAVDRFYRSIFFGKVKTTSDNPLSVLYGYLTTPRRYSPRWYHEGIAVFMETWMSGGIGRAMGSYDEMVFRTMVRDDAHIYDVIGLESEGKTIDFQVGVNSYLYGTRFMSYLAYKHGPEKILDWVSRTNDSKQYFASQFKRTFGVSLDNKWSQWINWEHEWQQTNLDSIRIHSRTSYREISKRALGSVSRPFYNEDERTIYAAMRYPGQVAHLAEIDIDTGEIRKICDVKGAALYYVTSLAYDKESHVMFYTTDNNRWRDLNVVDIKSGKSKRLMKDLRTGDLAFNQTDKSIWGIRHFNGFSTLVRIPAPYNEWDQIFTWPYGQDVFDIDISPDGSILTAALAEISGQQKLIKMKVDSLKTDPSYDVIFDFENSTPANFVFSPDGRYLYGSSYYSGVSNIYRYDFDKEDMDIISNCETGFFRPLPVSDDSLIVLRYTGKGFVPVMIPNQVPEQVSAVKFLGNEIAQKYPLVRSWTMPPPSTIKLDSLITGRGGYRTLGGIAMSSAYPVVEGYKDFAAFGMRFNFLDKLGLSGFDLTASYSPDNDIPKDERVHLGFNFHHWQWKLFATYNGADFYDLFGPTKSSRKGYAVGLQYSKSLLADEPKSMNLELSIVGYGDLERLPDFQNIDATFDKLLSAKVALSYHNVRKSLGAVDDEKGIGWQLISSGNYVNSEIFPRVFTHLDYGVALPINHSSVWLRTSAGYSFGDRDNPFANFFFGGFGNNWIDHLTEKRYRHYYSFPGAELNAIAGKTYAKAMFEWNLPPVRFRRFGFSSLYFNWARVALFTTAISTNFDKSDNRLTFLNLGAQLDFKLVLFSNLSTTLSFGFAAAMEKNEPINDAASEFMVSLKIL